MDEGHKVAASCSLTIQEAIGVNNRLQLAEVRGHIQTVIQRDLMLSGVTIVSPQQTSIDADVEIGGDTEIRPGTVIDGGVRIGKNCSIGPNIHLKGPQEIADGSVVEQQ